MSKAPETMEVDYAQRERDGTPVCEAYWVMMNHAEEMELQRNEARAFIKRQQDALRTTLPWMTPCAVMAEVQKCIILADEFQPTPENEQTETDQ